MSTLEQTGRVGRGAAPGRAFWVSRAESTREWVEGFEMIFLSLSLIDRNLLILTVNMCSSAP